MRRTQALTPLTPQERSVKDLLIELRLPFEAHHVFELSPNVRMSVDFLVFSSSGVVIECTYCSRRKGSAISELRRRCAFMDYRFGLIKRSFPKVVCGAFVEAPNENQASLSTAIEQLLDNADFASTSLGVLSKRLGEANEL